MPNLNASCPDCKSTLKSIQLIDAIEHLFGEGKKHVDLAYAAPRQSKSFLQGKIKRKGIVKGKICPNCGRIVLYGEPKA